MKKTIKAWAIIKNSGNLAVFSGELPIYWTRKVANQMVSKNLRYQVIECEITYTLPAN